MTPSETETHGSGAANGTGPAPQAATGSDAPAQAPHSPNPALAGVDLTDRPAVEDALRLRLGLRPLTGPLAAASLSAQVRLWTWLGPVLAAVLALVLRVVNLRHPHALVFDETYYVKQATSLLELGYEGEWPDDYDARFVAGDLSGLSTTADYVVHPPLGKWLLALGQLVGGTDNGFGWRIAAAVTGALGVLLVGLLVARLLRSPLLGTLAGFFLAVDGAHLVLSRTGLLDVFLSTFVLAGLVLVLQDQRWARARLASRVAADVTDPARDAKRKGAGRPSDPWGPRLGVRWWLVAAGIVLGLSCGIKWSGIYAVAAFGILAFVADTQARRAAGVRLWFGAGVMRGGVPDFVALVPTAALAYLASWASWFASTDGYLRQWAAERHAAGEAVPLAWAGDALASLAHYHAQMWGFHTTLDSEHSYMSQPIGWLIQWRPTSFYWPDPLPQDAVCSADRCVQAITSVGNPLIWWLGALALLVVLWLALARRDLRAWAILAGYAATYLPWFAYTERTIFTFYTVAIAPYVVMALTYALGWALGLVAVPRPSGGATRRLRLRRRRAGAGAGADGGAVTEGVTGVLAPRLVPARRQGIVLAVVVALVALVSVFFWPIWTGLTVPHEFWHSHMWLPSWV